jgi:hypothetical protein
MRKRLLILLLGTAALLSACGINNPNNLNTGNTLSGTVIGYDGGDANVEALWNNDSYGKGNIKADGSFTIKLETDISSDRLMSLSSEVDPSQLCSSLEVSKSSKGTLLPVLTITKNSKVLGHIGQVSSVDAIQDLNESNFMNVSAQAMGRVYTNQDATVKGQCQDLQVTIDLTLKSGWNTIYLDANGNGHASMASSGTSLDWHYLAQ